jgi:acyl carrier protein
MSQPNRIEVLQEIVASIAKLAGVPAESIDEGQRLMKDVRLDSLAIYELVVDLEERYGMQISNEDAERLETVGDAADYVVRRLAEGRTPPDGAR